MIITFTGHRDRIASVSTLYAIEEQYPGATWVHGGAKGFDTQVHRVALDLGKSTRDGTLFVVPPDYARYRPEVAPLRRNEEMVDRADLVIACFDGRQRGGTYATINYARRKGKQVKIIDAR